MFYITIYNIHMKNHGKNSAKIEEKPCSTCLRIANTALAKIFNTNQLGFFICNSKEH